MRKTIYHIFRIRKFSFFYLCLLFSLFFSVSINAQPPVKAYAVKNGRMYITLSKQISNESLDSFLTKFDLFDLPIGKFLSDNSPDSLKKMGWNLDINNKEIFVISKRLEGFSNLDNPGDKIMLAENHSSFEELFPPISSEIKYGYNRFKNKNPFATRDSVMTFFLRNNLKAKKVVLSGSFSEWSPDSLPMIKVDSGWIYNVKLGPGKYWYKFIVDGGWIVDKDNLLNENDGLGNVNSVVYKANYIFRLQSFKNAKKVYLAGSFNNWHDHNLPMIKTADGWQLPLYLADGTHTYRYVIDGEWHADPENPDRLPNEYNEFNSVIRIGKSYLFQLDGYTDAKQVILTGSFNGWRKDELFMKKTNDGWELPYTLGPGNYEYTFIVDGKEIARPENPGKTANLNFVIDPNFTFRLKGYDTAKHVYLSGDFNNWSPDSYAMKKEGDEWVLPVHLFAGKHLYKFVVDGKWITDPANKLLEQNETGTGNSVIWMGQ